MPRILSGRTGDGKQVVEHVPRYEWAEAHHHNQAPPLTLQGGVDGCKLGVARGDVGHHRVAQQVAAHHKRDDLPDGLPHPHEQRAKVPVEQRAATQCQDAAGDEQDDADNVQALYTRLVVRAAWLHYAPQRARPLARCCPSSTP